MMQLSIFKNSFDETRAFWRKNHNGQKFCEILAIIPADALSPEENNYCGKDRKKDYQCELWEHVGLAIWRCHKGDWTSAIVILSEYRDRQKPIRMLIEENVRHWFKEMEVIEYLEGRY
ncbi:hypothetical protein JCM9140_3116 [Halalkalibacter wakoensis JCM 9140]|uniref:Uncharacterized protein n=1 Tax=Halalkalibacter wakoensis JCM 9140 TaxID=1236970 RepID=W4Q4K4_9BACI|nr:hypothetical protein [Halalkalibacter wakoensis]GAE27006.1 hypothetical protein JCM9140_3116 [Halalkalibacter wakoensis JCM 9140]